MKIVKLKGSYYDMGLSHGQQLKSEIQSMVRYLGFGAIRMSMPDTRQGKMLFRYHIQAVIRRKLIKTELLELTTWYEKQLERYFPRLLDEIAGISTGAEVRDEDILIANFLGEIVNSCSIWAACGEATITGETLLGMNSDEEKESTHWEIIKILEPEDGHKVIANGMAGTVWLASGINERGLAMGFPMLWVRRGEKPTRQMPAVVLFKTLYQCGSVYEALAVCNELPEIALPIAKYIVDEHKVARIEWAQQGRDMTVIESGFLSNTNRPESEKIKRYEATSDWKESVTLNSRHRQKRMTQLKEKYYGKIDVDVMKAIASDHGEGKPVVKVFASTL
jgi:predicted choloylglycine hydrolase